uniref:G-protein coupled receptors family 1 profile domain-containing protein n=1 Tax=Plectus sambesii TaxID=2011161 RepID=A0A914VHV6_9BILA
MFILHTATGVSKWCWLFVSTLRFTAVYHPLWHLRQWRLGNRCVPLIFTISAAINAWLLWAVTTDSPFCTTMPFLGSYEANRYLHAAEIVWSYLLPICTTFILDARVMIMNPPRLMAISTIQKSSSCKFDYNAEANLARKEKRKRQDGIWGIRKRNWSHGSEASMKAIGFASCPRYRTPLYHWLAITTLNLILNTPDVLLRLIALFEITSLSELLSRPSITIAARSLYFAQFVVNAIYLTSFVFRRNVRLNRGREMTVTSIKSAEITMKLVEQMNDANVRAGGKKRRSKTDTETTTL